MICQFSESERRGIGDYECIVSVHVSVKHGNIRKESVLTTLPHSLGP